MTTYITELAQRVKHIISDMKLKHGDKDTYAPVMKWDEFLALVEALERKEDQCANWFQMAQKLGENLDTAEKRIAELESRSVKLPDLRQIVSGDRYVWSDGVFNYSQDVKAELTAKGIKWEAE
ncbi:hypothetical protein [Klebsiella pneumoniae]|uniref:hypothetical protein n=1 Tax=Klebsiella pneumoniae TaxID=573 RepID=UPI001BD401AC|nr:hypothetical protein [Klebsiella pneumoniae]QVQ94409.1 hypothetical protein KI741_10315 [Klebsiella pneumoniae]